MAVASQGAVAVAVLAALLQLLVAPVVALSAAPRGDAKESFLQALQFRQVLRVCNAYPDEIGMDVFLGEQKLAPEPLAYKACGQYTTRLTPGDKVDFRLQGTSAGTFTVSEFPAGDAVLLMVIYRHDPLSAAVAFESHIFPTMQATQVAVIDTYKGGAMPKLSISDLAGSFAAHDGAAGAAVRSEELRFDNVVAVNPGVYKLKLLRANSSTAQIEAATNSTTEAELVAVPGESYVILRCGVEGAESSASYPPELVIFPHSDRSALGGASLPRLGVAFALAALSSVSSLTALFS